MKVFLKETSSDVSDITLAICIQKLAFTFKAFSSNLISKVNEFVKLIMRIINYL